MLAQAVTGTPGHINTMANCVRDYVVPRQPLASLRPGDTLITNDPWASAGHLFDLTVVTPVFHRGRGVGWFASTCHATDIGGLTMGADASEVFEEGLAIPLLKLFRGGEPNRELLQIIRANVRVPEMVIGDLYAQQAGNVVGARKLVEMLDEYRLPDLETIGELILQRTEDAVRAAIREIPDGMYRSAVTIDGFDDPLEIRCSLQVAGDAIAIDYAGSSPQVERGINVVLNYTQAYSTYTVMAVVAPNVPNNEGSFRPLTVTAPRGSILNCLPSRGGRCPPPDRTLRVAADPGGAGAGGARAGDRRGFGRPVEHYAGGQDRRSGRSVRVHILLRRGHGRARRP